MPALIFYNIVSNIKDTDIKMLGVLDLSAFIYYIIGLCFGVIVYLISPIPRGWFGGLLLCTLLNNSSDMPIAYVQTLGDSQQMAKGSSALGGAYVVLFSLVTNLITFNLGGTRLVEWDFARHDPHRDEPTVPLISWKSFMNLWRSMTKKPEKSEVESSHEEPQSIYEQRPRRGSNYELSSAYFGRVRSRASESVILSRERPDISERDNPLRRYRTSGSFLSVMSGADSDDREWAEDAVVDANDESAVEEPEQPEKSASSPQTQSKASRFKARLKKNWRRFEHKNLATTYICHFLEDILSPQIIAVILGITIAMIPWAKRCFSNQQTIHGFKDPPDELPPLDFLMVFFEFFAGAQIPLGLIMVGASIQRLKIGRLVPGFWRTALIVTAFKLAILPIIACGWISRLRKIGWIDRDDPLAAVVLAVGGATPSATVQIYITALHSDPNGEQLELNCFGTCLIMQYICLPITLTFVVAFVLKNFAS